MSNSTKNLIENVRKRLLSKKALLIFNDITNWRQCTPDLPPCALCKELITKTPLDFSDQGHYLAFHPECAIDSCTSFFIVESGHATSDNSCFNCESIDDCKHISINVKNLARQPERLDWMDSFG